MIPTREGSYEEAIGALTQAIAILDAPDTALGYAYGLQRGQWGHLKVTNARDQLRLVRDAMSAYQAKADSRS